MQEKNFTSLVNSSDVGRMKADGLIVVRGAAVLQIFGMLCNDKMAVILTAQEKRPDSYHNYTGAVFTGVALQ